MRNEYIYCRGIECDIRWHEILRDITNGNEPLLLNGAPKIVCVSCAGVRVCRGDVCAGEMFVSFCYLADGE